MPIKNKIETSPPPKAHNPENTDHESYARNLPELVTLSQSPAFQDICISLAPPNLLLPQIGNLRGTDQSPNNEPKQRSISLSRILTTKHPIWSLALTLQPGVL